MAMAMHSDRVYPSAPTNVGIFPSLLYLERYSESVIGNSCVLMSRSRLLAFATILMAVERALPSAVWRVPKTILCDNLVVVVVRGVLVGGWRG